MSDINEEYRRQRAEIRERIEKRNAKVAFMLDAFMSGIKDARFVSTSEFLELGLTLKKKINLSEGINFTPLDFNDSFLLFDTEIKAGYSFGRHFHEKDEVCEVVSGELLDKSSGAIAKEGEFMSIPSFTVHEPSAEVDTILRVKFNL